MPQPFKFDLYDKKHLANLVKSGEYVETLFNGVIHEAVGLGELTGFNDPELPFYLSNYPEINKRIDGLLRQLHKDLVSHIEEVEEKEWMLSHRKNDAKLKQLYASTSLSMFELKRFKRRNIDALRAFQKRKIDGKLSLSEKVWSNVESLKGQLELGLDLGLREGKSAASLSRDVKQYLNKPDKLFRRVRDEHGVLRLSKAAAGYNPGQGVYRSSYKNALRLTVTEGNMAYRMSDHERWQQIPFVTGIEVKLSNNHTCNGVALTDICDDLAGVYPKNFMFLGWHPFCRCFAVPKLPSIEELSEYNQKILRGELRFKDEFRFKDEVKDTPNKFNQWVSDNAKRINKAILRERLPYFLEHNKKFWIHRITKPVISTSKEIRELLAKGSVTEDVFKVMGKYTPERELLHEQIIKDYINVEKVETDKVFMLGGAPANGKSTVVKKGVLQHPENIMVIDPDKIKSMIPEYKTMLASGDKRIIKSAANFVHEESSYISKIIQKKALKENYGVVFDGVNDGAFEKVKQKVEMYRKLSNKPIRADYVSLDSDLSVKLATIRSEKVGREVPLQYVRDMNREISILVPKLIKNKTFDELYLWDTNINGKPRLVFKQIEGVLHIEDAELYKKFLDKVKN